MSGPPARNGKTSNEQPSATRASRVVSRPNVPGRVATGVKSSEIPARRTPSAGAHAPQPSSGAPRLPRPSRSFVEPDRWEHDRFHELEVTESVSRTRISVRGRGTASATRSRSPVQTTPRRAQSMSPVNNTPSSAAAALSPQHGPTTPPRDKSTAPMQPPASPPVVIKADPNKKNVSVTRSPDGTVVVRIEDKPSPVQSRRVSVSSSASVESLGSRQSSSDRLDRDGGSSAESAAFLAEGPAGRLSPPTAENADDTNYCTAQVSSSLSSVVQHPSLAVSNSSVSSGSSSNPGGYLDYVIGGPPPEGELYHWLLARGLQRYAARLIEEEVTLDLFLRLTVEELKELGFSFGARKRLREAIEAANGTQAPNQPFQYRPKSILNDDVYLEHVVIGGRIGGGNFGEVYLGEWQGTTQVALKRLHSQSDIESFEREATTLRNLSHPNIVQFLGLYRPDKCGSDFYLCTEFLKEGSLHTVLLQHELTYHNQLSLSMNIAAGMHYLWSNRGMLHRDLAARNVLCRRDATGFMAKVGDFGLSRGVDVDSIGRCTRFAVKWNSPEVVKSRLFSEKSDVYSYGVVLWELFSRGLLPYHAFGSEEAARAIINGDLLKRPDECPEEVYQIMLDCWQREPPSRPTFLSVFERLKHLMSRAPIATVQPQAVLRHDKGAYDETGEEE